MSIKEPCGSILALVLLMESIKNEQSLSVLVRTKEIKWWGPRTAATPTIYLDWAVPSVGIPVRVSFLADCYISFYWVMGKFFKTNSGLLWCIYFRPWTYRGGLSYRNQLRDINIPEKQVFVGMCSLSCCYSSGQWQCYWTALPIRETISKCSWWMAQSLKQTKETDWKRQCWFSLGCVPQTDSNSLWAWRFFQTCIWPQTWS